MRAFGRIANTHKKKTVSLRCRRESHTGVDARRRANDGGEVGGEAQDMPVLGHIGDDGGVRHCVLDGDGDLGRGVRPCHRLLLDRSHLQGFALLRQDSPTQEELQRLLCCVPHLPSLLGFCFLRFPRRLLLHDWKQRTEVEDVIRSNGSIE